jgi:hypothetical protein
MWRNGVQIGVGYCRCGSEFDGGGYVCHTCYQEDIQIRREREDRYGDGPMGENVADGSGDHGLGSADDGGDKRGEG